MMNDFLDNLAANQYRKMHKKKTPVERLHDDMRELEERRIAELDVDGEYEDWLY